MLTYFMLGSIQKDCTCYSTLAYIFEVTFEMEEIHIIQQTNTALPLLIQGCFLPASLMLVTSFPFSKAQTLSVLSLEAVTIRVSSQSTALTPEQKNRTRLHEK